MKIRAHISLALAIVLCVLSLVACGGGNASTTTTTTGKPEHTHTFDYSSMTVDTDAHTVEYSCTSCGERKTENMTQKEFKITSDGVESTVSDKHFTIEASDADGFLGRKLNDRVVYAPGTVLPISSDVVLTSVFNATDGSHTHVYSKADGSTEPDCDSVGRYKLVCSCGNEITETLPAYGHSFSSFVTSDDGLTMKRACFVCGHVDEKPVFEVKEGGKLLAIGDSMTFGTKLADDVQSSYPKLVADALGYECENIALPGSEAYQWYSLLSGRPAPNGKTCTEINGLDKADVLDKIAEADVVVMTLGINDIGNPGYTQYRTPKQATTALAAIYKAIHDANPNAKVIMVNTSYIFSYISNAVLPELSIQRVDELARLLQEKINSNETLKSFVYYVDITHIMSIRSYFEDVSWNIDYLHPGYSGHIAIKDMILDYINVK